MNRRRFIATAGAMVTSTGALLGTGAFSTVSAERSFSVSTADDDSALLAIEVGDGTEASEIVDNSSTNGTVTVSLENINRDAFTAFDGLIKITNTSGTTNEIAVTSLTFRAEDGSGNAIESVLKVYSTGENNDTNPIDGDFDINGLDNKLTTDDFDGDDELTPGETVEVGILIDTLSSNNDADDIERVVIAAETDDS